MARDARVNPGSHDKVQVREVERIVHGVEARNGVDFVFYYENGVLGECTVDQWRAWAANANNFFTKGGGA